MNELDLAIAKIEGLEVCQLHDGSLVIETENGRRRFYSPSSRGDDCVPLIEKYKVTIEWLKDVDGSEEWEAIAYGSSKTVRGKTPQEAICRAIIEVKHNVVRP